MAVVNIAMEVGLFVIVSVLINMSFGVYLPDKCGDKIPGCYCTDTNINCNKADIVELSDIYPYITNQTDEIHIANGNIRSIANGAFINNELTEVGPLYQVKYLNLSGNGIVEIHIDAFKLLPNLEVLDLSNNNLSYDSWYTFTFTSIFDPLKILPELEVLDLSYNNISYIGYMEIDVIEQNLVNLVSLRLGGNPFDCDCVIMDLVIWINTTTIIVDDADHMTCASSHNDSLIGKQLIGLNDIDYCEPTICVFPFPGGRVLRVTRAVLVAVIAVVVMTVLTVIATVIFCRRRNRRRNRTQEKAAPKAYIEAYITEDVNVSKTAPYKIIM